MEHVSSPIAKAVAKAITNSDLSPEKCLQMFDLTQAPYWLARYEIEAAKQQLEANKEPVK